MCKKAHRKMYLIMLKFTETRSNSMFLLKTPKIQKLCFSYEMHWF